MTEDELTKIWEWVDEQRAGEMDDDGPLSISLEHTENLIVEYRKLRNRFAKYVGSTCEILDALIKSGPETGELGKKLLDAAEKRGER